MTNSDLSLISNFPNYEVNEVHDIVENNLFSQCFKINKLSKHKHYSESTHISKDND